MDSQINELYAEDGKQLLELVQEWIDENISVLICKSNTEDIKITVDK